MSLPGFQLALFPLTNARTSYVSLNQKWRTLINTLQNILNIHVSEGNIRVLHMDGFTDQVQKLCSIMRHADFHDMLIGKETGDIPCLCHPVFITPEEEKVPCYRKSNKPSHPEADLCTAEQNR